MFNSEYKKEALETLERTTEKYKKVYDETLLHIESLYEYKQRAVEILKEVEEYINLLSNKPKEISKVISEIIIRRKNYEKELEKLKLEDKLEGISIATASATMAIAAIFGTVPTGAAITSLSSVAVTNTTLAWLGGGTLAAGGIGIGGEALLAMCGPVGWAIGGASLIGGLIVNHKNKEIAEKAEHHIKDVKREIDNLQRIDTKVNAEIKAIQPLNSGIAALLYNMKKIEYRNWRMFTIEEKEMLKQLINSSESLSKRIEFKISV